MFVGSDGNTPENLSFTDLRVVFHIDEMPMILIRVGKDEKGIGVVLKKFINDLTFLA